MANEIIVGGKRFPCAVQVVTWYESKLAFPGLPMLSNADLITLHWTGGDGLAAKCHNTLRTRRDPDTGKLLNLSVHLFVDHRGLVHQFADALARCAHAGPRGNKRGPGIEISNRANPIRVENGITREVVRETVNGETTDRTTFTAPQIHSVLAILDTLCAALALPMVVPMRGNDVMPDTMSDDALAAFTGIVGHYCLERRKPDAGLAIMRHIVARSLRAQQAAPE